MERPFIKNSLSIRNNYPYDIPDRGRFRHTDSIYKYNNMGYRSNDDYIPNDPSKKIMFFGCSVTEGVGVEYEDCWPAIVTKEFSKKMGQTYKNYNLSYNGCSCEHIARIFYQTVDLYNPDLVIILWTSTDRREYFIDSTQFACITENRHLTDAKLLMFNELRNESDDFYNFLRQFIFVESMLENRKIKRIHAQRGKYFIVPNRMKLYANPLYWLEYDIVNTWKYHEQKGLDKVHPGPLGHRNFSGLVVDKINSIC